jgi:predicted RNA polymerase sigma factor
MLLTDARRPARADAGGDLIPLDEQDRTLWDRDLIAEGTALIDAAVQRGAVGEYQLQAAIAALHDRARTAAETDWRQIHALYELLERMTGSPVVALNRVVALAMVDGPRAGLKLLDDLGEQAAGGHRRDAVRAHLLEQAGETAAAIEAYRAAAAATTSLPERRYLTMRAARLG